MPEPDALLRELEKAVREAGRIAQEARKSMVRELKPDGSVVTNGDRLAEEFLRKELDQIRPGTPVWGEEFGYAEEGESGLWAVDPVDGTTNYAFGSPLWGVTVGLIRGERVEYGAMVLPDLDETYVAQFGGGAFCNGRPLDPIPSGPIQPFELVSYCDHVVRRHPLQVWPGKMRCTGSFVVEGAFVAQQRFRGMFGVREKLYDVAACLCIGRELGADIRYASGAPFPLSDLKANRPIPEVWVIFPKDSGFYLDP